LAAVGLLKKILRARQVRRNRRWILSLSQAQLLSLIVRADNGLDNQDCDGLVQLAYKTYEDGHKDAIVNRMAAHLTYIGFKRPV
jgi:hypothetical protein